MEEINFIKSIPIKSITTPMTLFEQEQMADQLIREINKKSQNSTNEYALPDHLEKFRLEYENASKKAIKLPTIISQLSPRSRKKIASLPAPNKVERQQIKKIESMEIHSGYIYQNLNKQLDINGNVLDPVDMAVDTGALRTNLPLPSRDAPLEVDRSSTEFYEAIEQSVRRKNEQAKKISSMFDHHPSAGAKPTTLKQYGSSRGGKRPAEEEPALHQSQSGKAIVLPKLAPVSYSSTSELSKFVAATLTSGPPTRAVSAQRSDAGPRLSGSASSSQYDLLFSRGPEKVAFGSQSGKHNSQSSGGQYKQAKQPSLQRPQLAKMTEQRAASTVTDESQPLLGNDRPHPTSQPSSALAVHGISSAPPQHSLAHEYSPLIQETDGLMRGVYDQYSKNREVAVRDATRRQQHSEREYLNQFSVEVFEQCGLDINKEYIRLRKFKSYIKLLLYYVRSFRLRAAFAHYKAQVLLVRKAVLRRAAQRVYCAIKAAIYWNSLRARELLKRNRLASEEDLERQEQRFAQQSAGRIQRAVRRAAKMRTIRRRLLMRRSATKIQKRMRGCIGRRRAHAVLLMHQYVFRNATIIQATARRRLALRKVL